MGLPFVFFVFFLFKRSAEPKLSVPALSFVSPTLYAIALCLGGQLPD
jgi:hypothetical protein